jgi:hypothetical protein
MFQYNKYMSDLVKRRETAIVTPGSEGSGVALNINDAVMEGILSAGAAVSNYRRDNDE